MKSHAVATTLFFAATHLISALTPETTPWAPLLSDPQSFAGFHQLGGKATYVIKDGQVTGTSVIKEPNSFMASDKLFGDFHLEYEFKIDDRLNSGVQIRSNSIAEGRGRCPPIGSADATQQSLSRRRKMP